jgi:N-acetylglucosamine transport system substrate-binding protein
MIINGSWLETEMLLDLPKNFEMRMMRIPYLSTAKKDADGNFLPINYGMTPDFMIVPSQAPQKEVAKDFLVFMARDDMLRYFTKYSSTLRPFSYDVSDLKPELSKFTNDCINIWETSTSYFAVEKGILANNAEVNAWITGAPYTLLVYGLDNDGTTPSRYCKLQYQEAKGNWQRWVDDSTK